MKKLTPRYRRWLRTRARNQTKNCRKKVPSIALITGLTGSELVHLGQAGESPPVNFCFDQNRDATLNFVAAVRRRSRLMARGAFLFPTGKHRKQRLQYLAKYYDFSLMERISPSAALVLAAEYDLRRRIGGRNPFAVKLEEWNPAVRDLLRELGFFDLLNIEHNVPPPDMSDKMILRFKSGSQVDPTEVGGPDSLLEKLFTFVGRNPALETQLYSAVLEAMNNVRDHAYPESFFHGVRHVKDWWLTGAADRSARRLTLSLYDQGITIPVSLPNTWGVQQLIGTFLERFNLAYDPLDSRFDGEAIETATLTFRSSTGLGHRGLGLAKIREVVDTLPGGKLRIVSRFGDYVARSGRAPAIENCKIPLSGTLVEIEADF